MSLMAEWAEDQTAALWWGCVIAEVAFAITSGLSKLTLIDWASIPTEIDSHARIAIEADAITTKSTIW